MGHCDSPTQYGRHGEFFSAQRGAGAAVDAHNREREIHGIIEKIKSVRVLLLLGFLRCYQVFLGPFLGGACKFYPSCSNYAYEAVVKHGARRGIVLAMKRLGRCRPFTKGGFDPVPDSDAAEFGAPLRVLGERAVIPGKHFVPQSGAIVPGTEGEPFANFAQSKQERAR